MAFFRNRCSRVLAGLALGLICAAGYSQSIQVTRAIVSPITNFDIDFFDLAGTGGGPTLFTLRITPSANLADTAKRYSIAFSVLCSTDVVSGLVYEGKSGLFAIPLRGILMTSNDFLRRGSPNTASLQSTSRILEDAALRDILLSTSKVPSGRVIMRFELLESKGQVVAATGNTVLEIANIRFLRLVTPGVEVSASSADIPQTTTPFPQFIWVSDLLPVSYGPRGVKFMVSVFEKNSPYATPSDIIQGRPLWTGEFIDVNYAQYPVSGAPALKPGATYFWQVRAMLQGPVNSDLPSEVYAFKIGTVQDGRILTPNQRLILQYLQMILGDNYAYLSPQLAKLVPDEQIVLDGAPVSVERLGEIARGFPIKKHSVRSVTIE